MNISSAPSTRKKRRRQRRRIEMQPTTDGSRVLDVYGTVTGNGTPLATERIASSIRDALG
jgi:hypothetical protein